MDAVSLSSLCRMVAVAALLSLAGTASVAASSNFSGSFAVDSQVQLFDLSAAANGPLAVTSFGYAGGIDGLGQSIAGGGFDTMLFLFDSTGALIAQSDDGLNALTDPSTGLAADAGFSMNIAAGDYTLALTQYDNVPGGFSLSDGFSRAGQGNFTPSLSGTCLASSFCDWGGDARTSAWNIEVDGAVTAVPAVPEPPSLLLTAAGLLFLAAFLGKRRAGAGRVSPR